VQRSTTALPAAALLSVVVIPGVLTVGTGYATFANAFGEEVSDLAERPD
jgi:hypothetical protein